MNIVPKLNLNKHPRDVDDYSLIDATNMIINNNSPILQTENSLTDVYCIITHSDNTVEERQLFYGIELLISDANNDFELGNNTIKYILPCNEELIIFVENNKNLFYIFRYNENNKILKLITDKFEYNGGNLIGTFTYNQNNLIIAISEYFEDNSKKIPLKVINLGSFDYELENVNKNQLMNPDLHPIVSKVIIPTVNTEYIYNTAYKGWYYIFIRYKHSSNNYTQWYNTNECIFVDSSKETDLIKLFVSNQNELRPGGSSIEEDTDTEVRYDFIVSANLSDKLDITNISFKCVLDNLDTRYDEYQLGFVCVSKSYTKVFRTNDINRSNIVFEFNNNNVKEYSLSELINSYFNYFNIKTLINNNNRLYIGNYLESDVEKNIDLTDINLIIKSEWKPITVNNNNVTEIKQYINNASIKKEFTASSRYYSIDEELSMICKFLNENDENTIYYDATHFYGVTLGGRNRSSATLIKCISSPKIITVSYINKEGYPITKNIHSSNFVYSPKTTVRDKGASGVRTIGTGKYYFIENGEFVDDFNDEIYNNNFGDSFNEFYIRINDSRHNGLVYNHHFDNYCNIERSNIEEEQSINLLKFNGAMPNGYYNLFIHFVDEYGIVTKGFNISDYINTTLNEGIIEKVNINNSYIYKISDTTSQYTNIEASLNKLPTGYIGWFLSYEKFEKNTIYSGAIILDKKDSTKLIFYSDKLNYSDKIDFNFDSVLIGDETYKILSKKLNVADSYNNVLKSTNIEIKLETPPDLQSYTTAKLVRTDINNFYKSYEKTLIPCSDVNYETDVFKKIKIKNAFYTYSTNLIAKEAFYNSALKIYQTQRNTEAVLEPYDTYSFYTYSDVPFESLQFNNEPIVTFFPDKGISDTSKEAEKTFVIGNIIEVKNTIDLYQQKQVSVDELYPKSLDYYNKNVQFVDLFPKTIRRSNVIQDESEVIAWRQFEIEQYKNITENKGNVIKLISIGVYFLVHTEHSLFLFNSTDTLKSSNGNIQLNNTDIWDIKYKEVLTSDLGYGGIQKEYHGIYGSFGYIFYDKSINKLFRYDNSNLERIDNDINEFILKLKNNDIHFVDDKQRNRILISFVVDNNKDIVLSYNYQYNVFVSHHTYYFEKGYSTKNNIYLLTKSKLNDTKYPSMLTSFRDDNFGNYFINGSETPMESNSDISIIVNTSYSFIKFLEYIKYKVNIIIPNSDINYSPIEGRNTYYAGDEISISSEFCNTGIINIEPKNKTNVNKLNDFAQPYWRFGNWHFNMIRNKVTDWIEDVANKKDDVIKSDEMSRVYGNWFVIKFKFNSGTQKEIETLDCKFSLDKN